MQRQDKTSSVLIVFVTLLALVIGSVAFPAPVRAASTITVTTSNDNTTTDTFCSLREAITNANNDLATSADCTAGSGNDTIVFAGGVTTITLGSTLPHITDTDGLAIDGGGDITISGNDLYRILMVDNGIPLTLQNLTVADGRCVSCIGAAIYNSGGTLTITNSTVSGHNGGLGGAIYSSGGTLIIANSIFSDNISTSYGGGIANTGVLTITDSTFSGNTGGEFAGGGAIYSDDSLTITNSTFSNNTSGRGAIFNGGPATITNSTFTGNSGVNDGGGGVYNQGTLTITNSTFSGNSANVGGDIYQLGSSSILNLYNNILANSVSGGHCEIGDGTISGNNNLIENTTSACGFTNGVNGNITGSDPDLGALTGSPAYFPLNSGSLAINAGNDANCPSTDQRGVTRPQGSHCDIGAYEVTPPGAAALVSPTGDIGTNYNPTYTWNAVLGATWYYLWVNGPSGNVIQTWYEASAVCGGGTCSVTPTTTLGGGSHTWWVQTWNSIGYGPWSSGMSFTTTIPTAPGAATLVSPTGDIGTNYNPTYTWNEVAGATWYYLWVNGPSGNVIAQWYEASAVCGGGTCSVTPTTTLGGGSHTWWVQTWNTVGYGPWSSGMSFTTSPLGAATLVSPTGDIATNTPTYTWNAVTGATWYYLWVNGPSGKVIAQWYEASAVCSGVTCTVTPATTLVSGSHIWWIQTWNSAGYGPWSTGMNFNVP